ncbi:4098_t:CDS:2, partial [Gigaspora margarita]
FAALFSDIGFSGHYLGLFLWNTPGILCGYMAWATVFFALASVFFTVCIAMNLHIIFINEYKDKGRYKFEKCYFTFAFLLALLLSLLPIVGNIGCWYRDTGQEYNMIWQWATLFGWIDASILYCAIVIIMVIRKLKNISEKVDELDSSTSDPTLVNKTVISSIVKRIVWYPMVPLAAQLFSSSVITLAYINHTISYPLFLLCYIGTSLQGLLHALVFSQDIAVTRAFQAIKLQWWNSNVNSYEYHYPHRSYNKAITDEFSISKNFIELKTLNRSKADVIINNDIVDDDINDDIANNNNSNIVSQPFFLEWLRYMLLIKLFSPPKSSSQLSQLISTKYLSPINSSAGNKPNTSSFMFGKNYSKQDITLDNQNGGQVDDLVLPEQPIHLKDSFQYYSSELSYDCLNTPISSDLLIGSSSSNQANISNINNTNLINTSNCTIGGDERLIDVIFVNGEQTKKRSEEFTKIFGSDIDISQEIEMVKLRLKIL